MRAIPEASQVFIVELLLNGWTPQDVAESGLVTASLPTIQRVAKAFGLARSVGAPDGTKHESHAKWSRHRAEVRRLRHEGHSLRTIAGMVGLRSPTQVSNLLSADDHKK